MFDIQSSSCRFLDELKEEQGGLRIIRCTEDMAVSRIPTMTLLMTISMFVIGAGLVDANYMSVTGKELEKCSGPGMALTGT